MPTRPVSPQLKALEGNRKRAGKSRIAQPVRLKGAPVMPTDFKADERKLWAFVIGSMPVDLLKRADSAIIERYVRAWAKYRLVVARIDAQGFLDDNDAPNPLLRTQMLMAKEMDVTGAQLGFSPASRSRLHGANDFTEDDDIMDALLGSDDDPNGDWFKQ